MTSSPKMKITNRILIPILALFGKIMLTCSTLIEIVSYLLGHISYVNIYTPIETVNVFAGLVIPNSNSIGLLQLLPVSTLGVYFNSQTSGILDSSSLVTRTSSIACNGENCTTIFLPGGVELARVRGAGNPNSTLLDPAVFPLEDASAIIINNAPGIQLDFDSVDPSFSFNETECSLYGGNRGQGIYICTGSSGNAYIIGSHHYRNLAEY
jgi:hypothetical protein